MSSKRAKYAARTRVPVDQTARDIEKLVTSYKCDQFGRAIDRTSKRAAIEFRMKARRIRFELPLPGDDETQATRERWRALFLVIKAKLASYESGIETFDEAFLAHIVMPDGRRFGEIVSKQLEFQPEAVR